MKTTITAIAAALLISTAVLIAAYNTEGPRSEEISLFTDVTEEQALWPKAEEILPLYGFDKDQWNGAEFRFASITDVDYNRIRQVSIPPAGKWLSNEFQRKEQVEKFMHEVEQIMLEAEKDSLGRNKTSAYLPIARELKRLSQSKASRKILIVYSDLMENGMISFYRRETLDSLQSHPEKLRQFFEKQMPIPQLNGIEVHFIYQSKDSGDSQRFRIVSGFYQTLLESKGATVNIGANLVL